MTGYVQRIAPSAGMKAYNLRLEAESASGFVLSVPVQIPRPRVEITDVSAAESCVPNPAAITGGSRLLRCIHVDLEARGHNFASGPSMAWDLKAERTGTTVGSCSAATCSHDFEIGPSAPDSYFNGIAEGADLSRVESAKAKTWLDYTPRVSITCRPSATASDKLTLSTVADGFCGALSYRWNTGATTAESDVPFILEAASLAEVTITDEAGQQVHIRGSRCRSKKDPLGLSILELDKRAHGMMALLLALGLSPKQPPAPEPIQSFLDLLKGWIQSAPASTPGMLSQRAQRLDAIRAAVDKAPKTQLPATLKSEAGKLVDAVKSGKYVETLEHQAKLASTEWNQEEFQQADKLMSSILQGKTP
ncbi:MAG: hypothetical protein HYV63_03655 [Candidatus Schekmanbacteria bacterium]|nr:hypothetical protein [Candidatus Schekmanbacteria bacterium]